MISEILMEGAENALTSREICELLNITMRELTAAVERERRAGSPICASTGKNPGYFLANHKGEMESYCNSLRHRAGEIFKTRKACIRTIDSLPDEPPEDDGMTICICEASGDKTAIDVSLFETKEGTYCTVNEISRF